MKILITGANGYVGSNLTRSLIEKGFNVDIIVRPKSNLDSLCDLLNEIKIFIHDGLTKTMMQILKKSNPDVVCHLAGISSYDYSLDDVEELITTNIFFGNQLVECMVRNKIFNLVNTGTYWQHYKNLEYNPTCLYAATKQAYADILKFYVESSKLNVINLKLFDNYGPNDSRNKIFNFINKSIINNKLINMSPGDQIIDLVYISDLTAAYLISINKLIDGEINGYNDFLLSTKNRISLKNLVNKFLKITNQKAEINWGGREYRKREIMIPVIGDKKLPGWNPKISIDNGIKLMIKDNK